jgi:hypothetical protein
MLCSLIRDWYVIQFQKLFVWVHEINAVNQQQGGKSIVAALVSIKSQLNLKAQFSCINRLL